MIPTLLSAVLFASAAFAAPTPSKYITPEMDKYLMDGIDDIYRMRFDSAEANAKKAIELNPAHPHAYMGLAGVAWTRYVYETDQGDDSLIDEFEKRTKKSIEVGEAWAKAHPDDAEGLMTLGASYGLSSRLQIIRHRWLAGYWQGRKALKLTKESVKRDPELWDAYLGLGMYDYYSDLYPRFIGVLAKIVLRGNRARGIEYLNMVAQKGHFSRSNAKILLVEVYTEDPFGAKDPARAVAIMEDLRKEYPDSAMMHSAHLVALFTAGRFEEQVKGAQEYVDAVTKGRYNAIEEGKGKVILGCGLWALNRHDEAAQAFKDAERVLQNGRPSRWAVWAHVKYGNLLDALGRRPDAVAQYKLAAAEPDRWDLRAQAKSYLSKAYAQPAPDRIPPP
jgi:tetratricopeptide (TPR) repeat protein